MISEFFPSQGDFCTISYDVSNNQKVKISYAIPKKYLISKEIVRMQHPKLTAILFNQCKFPLDLNNPNLNFLNLSIIQLHQACWELIEKSNFIFQIKTNKWFIKILFINSRISFINEVSFQYQKYTNPFHNYFHAITVMHGTYIISTHKQFIKDFDQMTRLALVLAGLCHDIGHTSRTNQFEINSYSKKTLIYNDTSVLENFHAAKTFKILSKEESNILEDLTIDNFNQIRQLIISNILATDMKRHFELVEKAEIVISQINTIKEVSQVTLKQSDIECLNGLFMHGSDFFGAVKPFSISQIWSDKVNAEFINQVTCFVFIITCQHSLEKMLQLPLTPFFQNLEDPIIKAKNEIGFLSMLVKPIWITINNYFYNDFNYISQQIDETIQQWQKQIQNVPLI